MSSGLSPLAIRKPRTNVVYFEKAAYSRFCSIINVLDAKHWLKLSASEEASIRSIWFGHWLTKRLSAQNTICWARAQKGRSQYKCVLWSYLTLNKLQPAPITLHIGTITYNLRVCVDQSSVNMQLGLSHWQHGLPAQTHLWLKRLRTLLEFLCTNFSAQNSGLGILPLSGIPFMTPIRDTL